MASAARAARVVSMTGTRIARVALTAVLVLVALTVLGPRMFGPTEAPAPGGLATRAARPGMPVRGGELLASLRSEVRGFNRYVARDQTTETLSLLTQSRLVRINRATFELEPQLADRWNASDDGLDYVLHLRQGVTWSDGTPFTSADVAFSFEAAMTAEGSVLASALRVNGQPIAVATPDAATVALRFPAPSGLGLRVLDNLPILPRHRLEASLRAGTFAAAWGPETPVADLVGTGPFVVSRYDPGQRVVLARNPRYWRTAPDGQPLPYLDGLVLEIVPDQNAELLRLQSGEIDFTQSELRPDDYVAARRAEADGTLVLLELGVSPDADAFWFSLKPEARRGDPRFAFVQRAEFRQALSHAVDREAFAETVYLGAAVPVWGPVTPGNRPWFSPNLRRYPYDLAQARALLAGIGLEDRDGNGVVEDAAGTEARFTVLTQRGVGSYEKGTALLRESAAAVGVALDIAPLEFGAMIDRMLRADYDAVYMRPLATDLDPAGNLDLWLSSGSAHFWNLEQATPATAWEAQIDALMNEQASTLDADRRRALFVQAQDILAEQLPVLYFAAPRMYYAHAARVGGVTPSVQRPPALWNAEELYVTGPPRGAAAP